MGMFGVISEKPCIEDLFYGTDYNSHMGSAFAGIAVPGKEPVIHRLDSQFKSRFSEVLSRYASATSGIGVISPNYPQPMQAISSLGEFALCKDGRMSNLDEIISHLFERGWSFTETVYDSARRKPNPIAVAAKIIAEQNGVTNGIKILFEMVDSVSLLLLHEKGIYAARAKRGTSPLFIAKKKNENAWAVSGENCAFHNLGYDTDAMIEMKPGEIGLITKEGYKEKKPGSDDKDKICSFLWIYTGNPASSYCGKSVEEARYRSGAALALRDKQEDGLKADLVAGVPDSGTTHAIGYSNHAFLPFKRPLIKYTDGYGRSYTPTTQEERDRIAEMKLIAIPDVAKDKKIVLCDDSIVRGTQLRNYTIKKLWNAGAKEIHLRIACPPLMFPCKYGNSTRTFEELAARQMIIREEGVLEPANLEEYLNPESSKCRNMVEMIRKDINVTSLKFQRLDDMMKAIGLEASGCTYCWNGRE